MSASRFWSKAFVSGLVLATGCVENMQTGSDVDGEDGLETQGDPGGLVTIGADLPDLIESAVSDPPATLALGQTFSASDTVTNQGTLGAGASFTKYYLSSGTTPLYLLGERTVGAVAANGGTDSGTASLKIPDGVAAGAYRLLACADSGSGSGGRVSQVVESNDANNCTASSGMVAITGPDLIQLNITASPASPLTLIAQTGTLTVTDTVQNIGSATSGTSMTRWMLSTDNVKSNNDGFVRNCINGATTPGRPVGSISPGQSDTGSATASPLCIRDAAGLHPPATGTYYVLACADSTQTVGELNEGNNCAPSSNTITIAGYVDLVETAVSFTPGAVAAGDDLTITDTVQNVGGDPSGASHTKFYLSRSGTGGLQTYLGTPSTLNPPPTLPRAVPSLTANGTNTASTALVIPDNLQNGNYTVYACADAGATNASQQTSEVAEATETNNCTAAAGLLLASADLVISQISDPPTTGTRAANNGNTPGSHFVVTATTSNIGTATAKVSVNKYYLSTDGVTPTYFLNYRQDVPSIPAGGFAVTSTPSSGNQNQQITIDSSVAPGSYWLLGCADGGNNNTGSVGDRVREANENNNCLASAGKITVN